MKCPTCGCELDFCDERDMDNDIYGDEIIVHQWWWCGECTKEFLVTRGYSQTGIHFEES